MTTPLVHQAIFGDVKGAHNLILASSNAPDVLLHRMIDFTDRILPTEVEWQPYICGYPLDNYYVLTRTFPDPDASRPGMVRTHALLLDLETCVQLSNLSRLIRELPTNVQKEVSSLSALMLENNGEMTSPDDGSTSPNGYSAVVAALVSEKTPVWIGRGGFEDIVCRMWRNLWIDARRVLGFRMSADPNDLYEQPATLICTVPELRSRWGSACLLDETSTPPQTFSPSEAVLMGLPAGDLLRETSERMALRLGNLNYLKKLERFVELTSVDTVESIVSAGRLLAKMAPDPMQATQVKSTLLKRLVQKTKAGGEEALLRLRNFDVLPFANGATAVAECVTAQLASDIERGEGSSTVVVEAFLASHPWRENVCKAIISMFQPWKKHDAVILWHWWQREPKLVTYLWDVLPPRRGGEEDLLAALPKDVAAELQESIISASAKQKWYELHAHLLAASALPDLEKLRRQVAVDTEKNSLRGLSTLADAVEDMAVLTVALQTEDSRLLRLAGAAAAKNPILLQELDPALPAWRSLWLSSIQSGGEVLSGLNEPTPIVHALMDAFLSGQNVTVPLLERVASYADLSAYARRPDLWQSLPTKVAEDAQSATAAYWLDQFIQNPGFDPPLEGVLEQQVLALWRVNKRGSPEATLRLFQRFLILSEEDFIAWLYLLNPSSLPAVAAIGLGRLVLARIWSQAAARLLDQAWNGHREFVLAIQECSAILSFWNRAKLGLLTKQSVLTETEWWSAWQELSTHLYPRGVDESHIWEDAAGDRAKVKGNSGQEQWASAFHLLRHGGAGKKITILGLLHQMRKDFPVNQELKVLEDTYKVHFAL